MAQTFDSAGTRIAFYDEGAGRPIVLVHGFAASFEMNWRAPGWVELLRGAGRRVVGLDCRGHGASARSRDPADYGGSRMPEDVVRLMDRLGIERADLMGYSMGGLIATWLLTHHEDRFDRVVLGGTAGGSRGLRDRGSIADALDADASPGDSDASATARAFRAFAEASGNDLGALAAVMRSERQAAEPEALGRVSTPVLIVVGEKDALIGDPRALRDAIPGAELVVVPDRDHLSVVGDARYKDAVLRFLA